MDRALPRQKYQFLKDQGFGYTLIERADKSSNTLMSFPSWMVLNKLLIVRARQSTLKSSTASFCVRVRHVLKKSRLYTRKKSLSEKDLEAMIKVIKSGRLKGEKKISEQLVKSKPKIQASTNSWICK